jgi:hypothetical protein
VQWLFDRFKRARRRPQHVACYLRENGPIAYELPLFADDPRGRVDAMFESGLAWYWTTGHKGLASEAPDWDELTRWSMPALLGDLAASDGASGTVIVGTEPQDSRPDLARDILTWGKRFATDEGSPLHLVIHRATGRPEHVFVAQQPADNILALLHAWGIDRSRADRRAYPRLKDGSLEALLDQLRQ